MNHKSDADLNGGEMKKTSRMAVPVCLMALMLLSASGIAGVQTEDETGVSGTKKNEIRSSQMAGESVKSKKIELGFRFSGSAGIFFGTNHVNDSYEGLNDWYKDAVNFLNGSGYSLDFIGPLDPIKSVLLGGVELFAEINPYFGFGLGIGYLQAKKTSGPVGFSGNYYNYSVTIERTFTHKVSALPIQITLYGGLPLGKTVRLIPYFGVGFYLGNITLEESYINDEKYWSYLEVGDSTWTTHLNPTSFGYHGGLNLDVSLDANFGLFLGLGALSASFEDLSGDLEWGYEGYDWWGNIEDSGQGKNLKLWHMEEKGEYYPDRWYKLVYMTDEDPNDWEGVRNVEPGKISLAQFRFVIGIFVYLNR